MGQPSRLEKITLVKRQGRPAQRGQASNAPTDRFNDGDHEDPLGSNKPELSKAPTRLEAPARSPQVPSTTALNVARYT